MGLSGRQASNLCGSIWWTSSKPVWVYLVDKFKTWVGLSGGQVQNLCGSIWWTSSKPVWVYLVDEFKTWVGLSGRQAKNLCGSIWQTGGQLLTLQSMVSSLAKSSNDRVGGEGLQHQHNQLHSSWIHRQGWGGGGGGLQHQHNQLHSNWIRFVMKQMAICFNCNSDTRSFFKKYSQNPHVQKSFSMHSSCKHLLELVFQEQSLKILQGCKNDCPICGFFGVFFNDCMRHMQF